MVLRREFSNANNLKTERNIQNALKEVFLGVIQETLKKME